MELIRISNQRLKLMLTPTDMIHFELNTECLGESREQLHRAFRRLLEEIRQQTDFDADDSHLSVQYFPSREGGCEMFISRLGEDGGARDASLPAAVSESTALRPMRGVAGSFRRDCVYRFEEIDCLLKVCRRLSSIPYICSSAAYRDDRGRYFLFLSILAPSPFSLPPELDFIVEYGVLENTSLLRPYLLEHATVICREGAVTQLASLA